MKILAGANLGLRFLLELGALAAVGYWGWTTGDAAARWALAAGSVAAVGLVWGLFVSPKATIEVARPLQFAVELAVWTAAGAALHAAGNTRLALAFVGASVVSGALNYAWD